MTYFEYQHEHDGVWLRSNSIEDANEAKNYIEYGRWRYGKYLIGVYAEIDSDDAVLEFKHQPLPPFERIRRITGYLNGSLDRFNDAKKAEVSERVKHKVD